MNIEKIEEILKEMRKKEKKLAKLEEQKTLIEKEKNELQDGLERLVKGESFDVNHEYPQINDEIQ